MDTTTDILNHVHLITEQRDQSLLSLTLLRSVTEMLNTSRCAHVTLGKNGKALQLLEISGGDVHWSPEEPALDTELSEALLSLEKTGKSGLSSLTIGGANAHVYTTFQDRGTQQYLIFFRERPFEKSEEDILSGMLRIHSNFQDLLTESQTDQLTRLANRKTFDTVVTNFFAQDTGPEPDHELYHRRRSADTMPQRVWLAMLDIDNFKRINDEFGHLYGDEILIHLANLIRSSFRHEDYKFRFGGEEFVIVLRADDADVCRDVLERFMESVRMYRFPSNLSVTLSIGCVEFTSDVFHVTLLDHADQAMYHSKQQGKDRVTFYTELVEKGLAAPNQSAGGDVDLF